MKNYKKYFVWAVTALAAGLGFTACQDDVDAPAIDAPVADIKANTTIAELKEAFWNDAANYADTIGLRPDGSHYIIRGVVTSNDEQGNVFKYVTLQDETGSISFSINSYNLYLNYRRGQEVIVDATGMFIGKYAGLQQFGLPSYYENGKTWQVGFMPPELFKAHAQLNGWPNTAAIDTTVVDGFSQLSTSPEGLRYWQMRLVRFNNVHFEKGGEDTFSKYKSNNNDDVNRTLVDAYGNNIVVRTSGYADFATKMLPAGSGDVIGLLGFYESLAGATTWQLTLIDEAGCQNFGNPTVAPGAKNNPMSVSQAIELEAKGDTRTGWVEGYIVGGVMPEVTSVTGNNDIEWSKDVVTNSFVIADAADVKDFNKVIVIPLATGSKLQMYGNLLENPDNYGRKIKITGTLNKYMDTWGLTGNSGAADTWEIEGLAIDNGEIANGDGTQASPFSVAQVLAGTASGTAWVRGYIIGSSNGMNGSDMTVGAVDPSNTNIFIANTADETDYTKCVPVQLPTGEVRTALSLQAHPENVGKIVSVQGSIEKYFGQTGVKTTSAYVLEGGSTPPTPPTPTEAVTTLDVTFEGLSALPTGWSQTQIQGTKTWYITSFSENYYAAMTGYKGTAPFDSWLVTPGIDIAKCDKKELTFRTQFAPYGATTTTFEVFVLNDPDPAKATLKDKLNVALPTSASATYSDWVAATADLSKYSGTIYIGWRYAATQDANYATWCVDDVKLNAGGGDEPTPPTPPTPSGEYKGDFNSFNDGAAKASPYGTYTNATGWTATNSIILGGTDGDDSNPYFKFIGPAGTLAPTLNGKKDNCGTLTSPKLTGGIGTLTFSYGFAFTDTKGSFTVTVKDASGNVIKTDTVTPESITKLTAYEYSLKVDYAGEFVIEIVNLGPSQSTSNKDRVSIWNLTWTNP